MASTYDKLPIVVSQIFKEIVEQVSTNLASDANLDITQVGFYCETWKELCARLDIEGKDETKKEVRYPFIAVIRNETLEAINPNRLRGRYTVVIAALSNTTWDSATREAINFIPIINPIYAEFFACLEDSVHVLNHGNIKHKPDDNLHLGTNSSEGNLKTRLPDTVDAKVITELELDLIGDRDLELRHGVPVTLGYVNNVSSLECNIGGHSITIRPLSWQYQDDIYLGSPVYSYYFSHEPSGSWGTPVINTGETVNFEESVTGDYYGYISSDDGITESRLYFYYTVKTGTVTKYSTSVLFNLSSITTNGLAYPYYPVTVVHRMASNLENISFLSISQGAGNAVQDYSFTPNVDDTEETELVIPLELPSAVMEIGMQVVIELLDTSIQLESTSYYQYIN